MVWEEARLPASASIALAACWRCVLVAGSSGSEEMVDSISSQPHESSAVGEKHRSPMGKLVPEDLQNPADAVVEPLLVRLVASGPRNPSQLVRISEAYTREHALLIGACEKLPNPRAADLS